MCPLCFFTLAWVLFGGGSASSLALLIGFKLKGTEDGDDCRYASDRDA
jgi:hypothetical protein